MKTRTIILLLTTLFVTTAAVAQPASSGPADPARHMALGSAMDLLPLVLSTSGDDAGKSSQTWLGIGSLRLRLAGADMDLPDGLAANNGFQNRHTTTVALSIDRCFGDHFDGWTITSGIEFWLNEMEHEDAPDQTVRWQNIALASGVSYTWRFWHNVYLEPSATLHFVMNDPEVELAGRTLDTSAIVGELSVKTGWFMDL